ncbi:hypothetical protein QBC39DRAFT_173433 [Podospora conica]|nr:hypothetical protein QBC39DRAFT_173433 [Schizothecium conicum]
MLALQDDISRQGVLDSSSKPSGKLTIDHHSHPHSGDTGLLTPPLPSPSPLSHAELRHGSTTPREDGTHGVRLPPISELLKLVPPPSTQPSAPRRQSNWSLRNGAPTPDFTPRSSPACDQSPLSPYTPTVSGYPSPPSSHWTHLPIRQSANPGAPPKRGRDEVRDDHRHSLPPPKRQLVDWEQPRRNSAPNIWMQQEASPASVPYFGQGLATPSPVTGDERAPRYLRRQSDDYLNAQVDTSRDLPPPYSEVALEQKPKKKKKENTPYTQQQEFFIRYFVVDLGYSWEVVQEHYMRWFPKIHRTVGALTCEYYRTNKQIPVIEDGLLVFGGPRKPQEQLSKRKYRGLNYVCKEQQCRKDKIHTLLSIFPEEYEDPGNMWIRPEHRGKARQAAQRRQEQRVRETRRWAARL